MCKILKKTLAVTLIGLGIGILLVLLLPFAGCFCNRCCNYYSWNYMAF